MNIEGNKVVWKEGNLAITETKCGYALVKQITIPNHDGTSFRYWSQLKVSETVDTLKEAAKREAKGSLIWNMKKRNWIYFH